jgi:CHAT domain-containing protein
VDLRKKESRPIMFRNDPEKPYAHPYSWAPFIMMGNWK